MYHLVGRVVAVSMIDVAEARPLPFLILISPVPRNL